jgi:4-nitrophenyl phosphatase
MNGLNNVGALILDMDGVLWEGGQALPGLAELFAIVRARGIRVALATNNASQTPQQYVSKMAGFGIEVSPDEILTSATSTAHVLARNAPNGQRKVFAIGGDGVQVALREHGFELLGLYQTGADFVVVGMDRGLSWDKLATATLNIRAGARFIGTNPDKTLPSEHGLTHGNGAILAALTTATGIAPVIIGKPEPTMYQIVAERLGLPAERVVAVGDRLDTDILGAVRAGMRSVLVLTGVSTEADVAASPYQPGLVLPSIVELTALLAQAGTDHN